MLKGKQAKRKRKNRRIDYKMESDGEIWTNPQISLSNRGPERIEAGRRSHALGDLERGLNVQASCMLSHRRALATVIPSVEHKRASELDESCLVWRRVPDRLDRRDKGSLGKTRHGSWDAYHAWCLGLKQGSPGQLVPDSMRSRVYKGRVEIDGEVGGGVGFDAARCRQDCGTIDNHWPRPAPSFQRDGISDLRPKKQSTSKTSKYILTGCDYSYTGACMA